MSNILDFIQDIPPKPLKLLNSLGVYTYWDALLHIPLRYDDLTKLSHVSHNLINDKILIEGTIISSELVSRTAKPQLHLKLDTNTKIINIIFFHFYPNYITKYPVGAKVRAFAKLSQDKLGNMSMLHPKLTLVVDDISPLSNELTPIYSTTEGLSQDIIKKVIVTALRQNIVDTLSPEFINTHQLLSLDECFKLIHTPTAKQYNSGEIALALKRLKFDEILAQQLVMYRTFKANRVKFTKNLVPASNYTNALLKLVDFQLTTAQKRVFSEISQDICSGYQMNRLLQGDVGSGKTIVAILAMLLVIENNRQACLIAPTEILAKQHYDKLTQLVVSLGIKVIWLSGSLTSKQKSIAKEAIATEPHSIIIGTHAVLQRDVVFNNLGLVIVDEQHKFGVEQRLEIMHKGSEIHLLMMSATPIPRSLAMSYYAELNVSTIDELPKGRQKITTVLVNNNRRQEALDFAAKAIQNSRQVYWVCPLIEESEKLNLENATRLYDELTSIFGANTVGLVHGKLTAKVKDMVMQDFIAAKVKILVATSVVEVGVDVANASIMIIEHSERIGLSQLHQLRGRVGRGHQQSHCILLYQPPLGLVARRRLNTIYKHTDGFIIANEDLLIRGPGEFLGARQSGLPKFKFVSLETDMQLLLVAKGVAKEFYNLNSLAAKEHVKRWFYNKDDYYKI